MYLTIFNHKEADKYLKDKGIEAYDEEKTLLYAKDPFVIVNGLVEDEDNVVALGICKLVNEFKLIVNPQASQIKKAAAIQKLIVEATKACRREGSNEVVSVITQGGKKYVNFLNKRYGFEELPGIPMRLEI